MASGFNQQMDKNTMFVNDENSSLSLKEKVDPRVDLFFKLVRGLSNQEFKELFQNCLINTNIPKQEMMTDLLVMCFQTRNCRGGKGERDLFKIFFLSLYQELPEVCLKCIPLILHYGYGKDLISICQLTMNDVNNKPLFNYILDFCVQKIKQEYQELLDAEKEQRDPKSLSLLSKWIPSQEKHKLTRKFAYCMFPKSKHPLKEYRHIRTSINKYLNLLETKMCQKRWGQIDPTEIPSLCLAKNLKALINEKKKIPLSHEQQETGNRFPQEPDRVGCRQNMMRSVEDNKCNQLKGKQLYPYENVAKLMYEVPDDLGIKILQSMWNDIAKNLKTQLKSQADSSSKSESPVNLGELIPLSDVSGSISGIPMLRTPGALGILVSELTSPEFANRILTFESSPRWFRLDPSNNIYQKVRQLMSAPWGGSTNFEAAIDLILEVCVAGKLNPEQIPDLLILSNMQFNQAGCHVHSSWETQYESIVRKFSEAGTNVCGQPWPAPTIIFWNLHSDTLGIPSDTDIPGVKLLSGFYPSLFKCVIHGDEFETDEIDESTSQKVSRKSTPSETLRKILDDPNYDLVRQILSEYPEGIFEDYTFFPTPSKIEKMNSGSAEDTP